MRHLISVATLGLPCAAPSARSAQTGERAFVPVTDAMLKNPAPGDWLMWRRTLNGWGYSPLEQVNKQNVAKLEQVWSYPLGMGNQESTPLVYDGVMYVPNGGDYVQAFDADSGTLLWEYRRFPEGGRGGTNRNLAIWGTTLIDAGADNPMYAIDARTGKLVWETPVLDPTLPARASSGPIVANGKVITGRQCQPQATHESCVITAHDAATGKELWRTRTIPRKGEPGDESWGDVPMEQRWHVGTWMVPSYDAELDRIYIGTSVTIPAPKFILGGVDKQHLYHNSTLALNPADGKIVWYYQHLNDHWDLDHPFERLLVDTAVAPDASEVAWINPRLRPGERRRVMTGIPGQDRHRLHARSRDRRVPLGAADGHAERRQEHRRRDGQGRGRSRARVHAARARADGVPRHERRQELAGRRVQPAHERDVHADAEHVHERHDPERRARSAARVRVLERVHRGAGRARTSASSGRSRPRRARRCGSTSSASA